MIARRALPLLALPALARAGAPLRVLTTGVTEAPLRALAARLEAPVELATTNGGQAARRLRAGEPFDLAFNAAPALEALIAEGILDGATRRVVGVMRLALALRPGVPAPEIGREAGLRAALLAAETLAHSDAAAGATSGRHVEALMERLGIAEAMAPRRRPFPRGQQAAEAVARGEAAMGIVQVAEILSVPGVVAAAPLPDAFNLLTLYAGAVHARAAAPERARAFLARCAGEEGAALFRAAGFG